VSDVVDEAQAIEEAERERAIEALRQREPSSVAFTPADCLDCGDEITAERRKAVPHACRCTSCQAKDERVKR
jgi:phage/conjugal plasmid C-4 type zinc finger TraR family protein